MSTFASDFIEGFDARWSEVDTLIDMAQGLDDGDKEYCALCRATIVLIVAILKDLYTRQCVALSRMLIVIMHF